MSRNFNKMIQLLIPFLLLGVFIALLIGLVIMFSYIFLWGLLIGGILWIIAVIKDFLFPSKTLSKSEGRVIEHNDKK